MENFLEKIDELEKRESRLREALDATAVIIQVALKHIKNHEGTKALEYIKAAHTEARAALAGE